MNFELCYFQGGIKTALCILSVMLLCRYIEMTRLCNENFREKFYIFNTYFFGKLEKALFQPVWSFFVMKSYFSYQMSCIMSLFKIGIIILFWVRNTWAPCNKFMLFFPKPSRELLIPLLRINESLVPKYKEGKTGHTQFWKLPYKARSGEINF